MIRRQKERPAPIGLSHIISTNYVKLFDDPRDNFLSNIEIQLFL